MRKSLILAAGLLMAVLPATVEAQFFSDNFDSYATFSFIAGQGGWETWDNDPSWDTYVTDAQSFSSPNSLFVAGPADIVHQFTGVNSGVWYAKAQTYVPSSQTGEMYFILLNTYAPGGASNNWSVQVVMCQSGCTTLGAVAGQVVNLGGTDVPGAGSAPLMTDQWVEIMIEVDFNLSIYTLYYDGVQIDQQSWTTTGLNEIQAMDLFSNGSTESYMDNIWLDTTVPVELMSFTID